MFYYLYFTKHLEFYASLVIFPCALMDILISLAQLIASPFTHSTNLENIDLQSPLPSFLSTSYQITKAISSAWKWSPHVDLSTLMHAI